MDGLTVSLMTRETETDRRTAKTQREPLLRQRLISKRVTSARKEKINTLINQHKISKARVRGGSVTWLPQQLNEAATSCRPSARRRSSSPHFLSQAAAPALLHDAERSLVFSARKHLHMARQILSMNPPLFPRRPVSSLGPPNKSYYTRTPRPSKRFLYLC